MTRIADEEQRELLQEMLGSPGWSVFLKKVLSEELKSHDKQIFTAAREFEAKIRYYIGQHDGILDLLKRAYEAADVHIPDFIKERRNSI